MNSMKFYEGDMVRFTSKALNGIAMVKHAGATNCVITHNGANYMVANKNLERVNRFPIGSKVRCDKKDVDGVVIGFDGARYTVLRFGCLKYLYKEKDIRLLEPKSKEIDKEKEKEKKEMGFVLKLKEMHENAEKAEGLEIIESLQKEEEIALNALGGTHDLKAYYHIASLVHYQRNDSERAEWYLKRYIELVSQKQ